MGIPENQVSTWTNQGATTTSMDTHGRIRTVLEADGSHLSGKSYEMYLQGSYRNSTNIRGDSDVDLVVQYNGGFITDISNLSEREVELFNAQHSNGAYGWSEFKADVIKTLSEYFGSDKVKDGNKSIKISGVPGLLRADVVPCVQYRFYQHYNSLTDQSYIDGMTFYTRNENRQVINFPKLHYSNGASKNQRTNENYKPSIRMFKNARRFMREREMVTRNLAPSYFIECLLYNVPDSKFSNNFRTTYVDVVNWLANADYDSFKCQNEQTNLFGPSEEQWNVGDLKTLLTAYAKLWNEW